MTRDLCILGSTGSIGTQALDVCKKLNIKVSALTADKNFKLIEEQARFFKPQYVAMYDEKAAKELKIALSDTDIKVGSGLSGICEATEIESVDTVLNSVVGMVGLLPTLSAVKAKKNVALANKETLVAGGKIVTDAVKENNVKLYPVDSEHSAIFQCLQSDNDVKALNKIILTASGGPFFGKTKEDLINIKKEQALKHPNWSMGAKITIDSATMMNKGLEVIEAVWLFGIPEDKIDVVVHRESIIHSLVEFNDYSVLAQLGLPDMRIPIQYALTYPSRVTSPVKRLDLSEISKLTFFKPDTKTFECLELCRTAIRNGGINPAVANSANEQAVALFLEDKISFLQIADLVRKSMEEFKGYQLNNIDDILKADIEARKFVQKSI